MKFKIKSSFLKEKSLEIGGGEAAWISPRRVAARRGLSWNYSDFNAPSGAQAVLFGMMFARKCEYLHVPSPVCLRVRASAHKRNQSSVTP